MSLGKCRNCRSSELLEVMVTKPLPEYVWPIASNRSTRNSPCRVYHCRKCNLLQLQNFSDTDLASFYAHGSFVEENMKAKELRLAKILNALGPQYFKDKKVLDVGGGNNPFVKLLNSFTQTLFVSDFDISKETAEICRGHVYSGKFEDAKIPDHSFDVILSFHSMEHMNEPARVVQKMKSLLTKEGKLIVEVPHFTAVVEKIPYYSVFHQHINMFTKETLIELFQFNGFQLESVLSEDLALLMVFRSSENITERVKKDSGTSEIKLLAQKMKALGDSISSFIQMANPNALAVYGAGGSSALLVHHFDSIRTRIKFCYDREISKQGRCLPGTQVQINPPSEIEKSDAVIFLSDQIRNIFKDSLRCPTLSIETLLNQAGGKTCE